MAIAKAKPKKKRKKLSADELKQRRIKREHEKLVKGIFKSAGFVPIQAAANKEFEFDGVVSDFDDVFVYENIIVLVEYTTSQESDISTHLKKKKIIYDKINDNKIDFLNFLFSKHSEVKDAVGSLYSLHQIRVLICYASLNTVKSELKSLVPGIYYLDYNIAKYFDVLGKTIKLSARFELFDFFGLSSKDVAQGVMSTHEGNSKFAGSILPESHSNFGEGFKVVSFYINPSALLERAYVLRKYGWRDGGSVYQRMILKSKISSVRKYLKERRRVFINNIIVTLPNDTKLLDDNDDTIKPKDIQKTQPGTIQLPARFNSVGLVDGQHRVFSYHEGGLYDEDIATLRDQQNLLVTGIVFPPNMDEKAKLKFEATLFLEINSTQTNARSELIHEINLVINPYSADSIAKRVMNHLNDNHGPLRDEFERYFFEKGKLKTTSVVSFALRPLVNPTSKNSLFSIWKHDGKIAIIEESSSDILTEYVKFCSAEINKIFSAVKANIPSERWTADRKQADRFLTTSNVNGILSALRRLAASGNLYDFEVYREWLSGIKHFKFDDFKSSQYNRMGGMLYDQFLKKRR